MNAKYFAQWHANDNLLPKSHIVQSLSNSNSAARKWIRHIFLPKEKASKVSSRLNKRYVHMVPYFRNMIQHLLACNTKSILQTTCRLPRIMRTKLNFEEMEHMLSQPEEEPSRAYSVLPATPMRSCADDVVAFINANTERHKVFTFLRCYLTKAIPMDIWGGRTNFKIVLSSLHAYLASGKTGNICVTNVSVIC